MYKSTKHGSNPRRLNFVFVLTYEVCTTYCITPHFQLCQFISNGCIYILGNYQYGKNFDELLHLTVSTRLPYTFYICTNLRHSLAQIYTHEANLLYITLFPGTFSVTQGSQYTILFVSIFTGR